MRRDNRGISRIVEFVIMFTVFLVIVTSFYSLVNIWTRPPIVNYNQEEAMRVSEVLIGNPGCMDNNNSKTNWEDYPAYYKDAPNIDTNMTALGFTKDKQSYGVLSMSKILGMGKITYSRAKEMLALSPGQNFNISFQIIGNETKIYWGADYTNAKNVGIYKRIVAVYNPINNNYTSAKLTICIFDGGTYNEKIVINEIMYAPPPPLSDEDHEWIELHNPTSMSINLTNWLIGNKNTVPVESISWTKLEGVNDADVGLRGAIIPANGYGVIYADWSIDDVKKNFSHNPDAIWLDQIVIPQTIGGVGDHIAGRMLEDSDTLILKNRYWDTVDEISYTGVPGSTDTNESLERISPWDDNWYNSSTGCKGGTLGRRNTVSIFGNLISIGPDRYKENETGVSYVLYNITVMNNGNINDTITISNISELGWNVNITWLSGGNASPIYVDGAIVVNLSAINLCDYVNETCLRLMVNVTIPAEAGTGDQNIAIIVAVSEKYSIAYNYTVFDTATLLTKVS